METAADNLKDRDFSRLHNQEVVSACEDDFLATRDEQFACLGHLNLSVLRLC